MHLPYKLREKFSFSTFFSFFQKKANWPICSGQNEKLTSDSCSTPHNQSSDNISRFFGDFEFYFFFSFLRLKSVVCRPYGIIPARLIKRNIAKSYARFCQSPYERWRKLAQDGVILHFLITAVSFSTYALGNQISLFLPLSILFQSIESFTYGSVQNSRLYRYFDFFDMNFKISSQSSRSLLDFHKKNR